MVYYNISNKEIDFVLDAIVAGLENTPGITNVYCDGDTNKIYFRINGRDSYMHYNFRR